ncbi:MAG TPA: hypothetical protein VFK30_06820, partial [Anaerolineae bacterium]|nr:hypothetical protein [Anaerolineae bacterium]
RGLRLDRSRWIALAGVFVGLNLYTYLAARLFPLVIAVFFIYIVIADRDQRKRHIIQFVLLTQCAILIFLPLGIYFIGHPAAFMTRIQQVAPHADQAAALIDNLGRALGMFFISGDPYIRFNEPLRPLFPVVLGLLFVIGLVVAFIGIFRSRNPRRRFAYFAIVIATLLMLLPTALAVNEITPSNLRAIGLMPLVFVFPALGAWRLIKSFAPVIPSEARNLSVYQRAARKVIEISRRFALRNGQQPVHFNPRPIISVLLTALMIDASVSYFGQYVHEPQLYIQSDGDLADISTVLNHTDTSQDQVYIAALHYRHPTVAALANSYSDFKWLSGNKIVVMPNRSATWFFARLAQPDQQWLNRFLPPSSLAAAPLAPDGQTDYRVYHLAAPPAIKPQVEMKMNFGNVIQLLGYDREGDAESGQTASVTLYWRILNRPDRGDYSTFIQLRDDAGFEWGQAGSFDYPSEEWTPGEVIINRIDAPIGAGAPPGDYELRLGWYSQAANQRLNIIAEDGSFGGTVARLAPIKINRPAAPPDVSALGMGRRVGAELAAGLELLGYSQETAVVHQGERFFFTLFWQSHALLKEEPVSIQLQSSDQTIPLTSTLRLHLTEWLPNEVRADRYGLRAPPDTPPGTYTLTVAIGSGSSTGLGTIEVLKTDRILVEPQIDHRVNMMFGDAIELVGYNIDPIHLTLIWRSIKSIDQDYTVFTHVLDQSGQQIGGQDNQPVNGTYPTSRWSPGEYVIDQYDIKTDNTLEVGLYDPETGARLGPTVRLK